jgi:hypothetical protein
MSIETTKRCVPFLAALLGAAGCDPHADPGYQGEALATLRGEVRLEREEPPPSDEIEVFYQNYTDYVSGEEFDEPGDLMQFAIVERVSVTGDYPANFTLELFEPPPIEALTDFTTRGEPNETRLGLAIIASSYECWDFSPIDGARCIFGGAGRVALVWAEDDIVAGTRTANFLGATLEAGYHLLQYRPNFATPEEFNECGRGEESPENCEQWTLLGEAPLDTSLSVRLIDGHDHVFGNNGGALLTTGGLELPHWFDRLHLAE